MRISSQKELCFRHLTIAESRCRLGSSGVNSSSLQIMEYFGEWDENETSQLSNLVDTLKNALGGKFSGSQEKAQSASQISSNSTTHNIFNPLNRAENQRQAEFKLASNSNNYTKSDLGIPSEKVSDNISRSQIPSHLYTLNEQSSKSYGQLMAFPENDQIANLDESPVTPASRKPDDILSFVGFNRKRFASQPQTVHKTPRASFNSPNSSRFPANSGQYPKERSNSNFHGFTSRNNSAVSRHHDSKRLKSKRHSRKNSKLVLITRGLDLSSLSENYAISIDDPSIFGTKESKPRQRSKPNLNVERHRSLSLGPVSSASFGGPFQNLVKKIRNIRVSDEEKRNYWIRDASAKECYSCKSPFTTFRRKHHCRVCGQVFCNKCSKVVPGSYIGFSHELRVCEYCFNMLRQYPHNQSSHDLYSPYTSFEQSYPLHSTIQSGTFSQWDSINSQSSPQLTIHQSSDSMFDQSISTLDDIPENQFSGTFGSLKRMLSIPTQNIFSKGFWQPLSANSLSDKKSEFEDNKLPFRQTNDNYEDQDGLPRTSRRNGPSSLIELFEPNNQSNNYSSEISVQEEDSFGKIDSVEASQNSSLANFSLDKLSSNNEESMVNSKSSLITAIDGGSRSLAHSETSSRDESVSGSLSSKISRKSSKGHRRRKSNVELSELTFVSGEYSKRMLYQILHQFDITNSESWHRVLHSLMMTISHFIRPNVRMGDDIDLSRYIKIKKVPGGSPNDSEIIFGVVCTKNFIHKNMIKKISNPKILLLTFALDYYRVDNQFMSLEPLISQEKEYLKNLINGILELKPHIVLVANNVSRIAQELFLDAGISVAANVKFSVIRSISRSTGAEIVSSLDKITLRPDARLGTCSEFVIKTYISPLIDSISGNRKTIMLFDGCPKDRGCTVILRGGNMSQLSNLKKVLKFIILMAGCLRLEAPLLNDQKAIIEDKGTSLEELDSSSNLSLISEYFLRPYRMFLLSVSPGVSFPPPYLLNEMASYEKKLEDQIKEWEARLEDWNSLTEEPKERKDIEHAEDQLENATKLLISMRDDIEIFIRSYENSKVTVKSIPLNLPNAVRYGLLYAVENQFNPPNPFDHQNLVTLYGNINSKTRLPCQPPDYITIEYFKPSDMTIGQYLEQLCFDSNYLCPQENCRQPMLNHFRSYIHGNSKISVLIDEVESSPESSFSLSETIMMHSECRICKAKTPMCPMSESTWKYSFGKFLELSYYSDNLKCRPDIECSHNIIKDHIRYFQLRNLAVSFEYDEIMLNNVCPPQIQQQSIDLEIIAKLKEDDMEKLKLDIINYYRSIYRRLKQISSDDSFITRQMEWKIEIEQIVPKIAEQKVEILRLLSSQYDERNEEDTLALNDLRKKLHDYCIGWDREFSRLSRKLILPDRGDKRMLTSNQFRRLFSDSSYNNYLGSAFQKKNNQKDMAILENEISLVHLADDLPTNFITSSEVEQWVDQSPDARLLSTIDHESKLVWMPKLKSEVSSNDKSRNDQKTTELKSQASFIDSNSKQVEHDEHSLQFLIHQAEDESLNIKEFMAKMFSEVNLKRSSRILGNFSHSNSAKYFHRKRSSTSRSSNLYSNENSLIMPTIEDPKILKSLEMEYSDGKFAFDSPEMPFIHPDPKLSQSITFPVVDSRDATPIMNNLSPVENPVYDASSVLSDEASSMEPDIPDSPLSIGLNSPVLYDSARKLDFPKEASASSKNETLKSQPVEGERASFIKTLKDMWQAAQGFPQGMTISLIGGEVSLLNEIAGWKPLDYPFTNMEHFSDSSIVIREDEPTSLVAFALNSRHYRQEVKKMRKDFRKVSVVDENSEQLILEDNVTSTKEEFEEFENENDSYKADSRPPPSIDNNSKRTSILSSISNPSVKGEEMLTNEQSYPIENIPDNLDAPIERMMLSGSTTHIRYQFTAGHAKCFCRVYFAEQFDALRNFCGINDDFVESLSRCIAWNARGGQSGSPFYKTFDSRWIVKALSKAEIEGFLRFAPAYFEYMARAFFHDLPTLLVKLVGVYRVGFKNTQTGRAMKQDIVVMENLFYNRKVTRIFDLKGSMRNRHIQSTGKRSEVLLDENLMEIIRESPLYIREHSKRLLRTSVWNDTLFLSKLNVMDYSLLVGVDEEKGELVVGIVDYIRTFTWDKKLESWVKETGFLGGGGQVPTIISPKQYKVRFRDAMEKYFLMVPDKYCDEKSLNP